MKIHMEIPLNIGSVHLAGSLNNSKILSKYENYKKKERFI